MKRHTGILLFLIFVFSTFVGCGLDKGSTDPTKEPWQPGPLGGKADDTIVDKGSLGFGAALNGITVQKNELHRYSFFALAGADLQVTMTAVNGSGNPDTYLQLEAPGGKVYVDDDGGSGMNSRLEVLGLPDTGTYVLYATTYRRAGSGDYDLSLQCLSGNCASSPQMQSDDDHDGYSEVHGDCDDSNPDMSPGAPEIPGNSKDDNCNGKTDEGCNDPTTCDRPPRAPRSVKITGKYNGYSSRCRVTGQAEPNTKLTIYSNSRRTTLQSNFSVPSSGGFGVTIYGNCYSGDVLVLHLTDQSSSSGKVWARVSGTDSYAPLSVTGLQAAVDQPGQVVIQGNTELGATVLLTNTSIQGKSVEAPAGAGFGTKFVGALAASAGDWIKVAARDPAGKVGQASHVQVPGADSVAPSAPFGVKVTGKYNGYSSRCRVTGKAEPNSKLTIYSNSRRTTLQSSYSVPASGGFGVTIYGNCYSGDVLVLWVNDGAHNSPRISATVSGTDSYAPLAPASVSASGVQGGQVTVIGKAEINGQALLYNDSAGTGPVTVSTTWSNGLDASFSASISAASGDWLRVRARDAKGNLGAPAMVQVGGSDTTAPDAPTGVKVTGKYNGYSSRCRVTGQAEPNSKLTIYSNSRRTTLQSNYSVPSSGGFGVTIYGNCYSGDVLVLWINDGSNSSSRIHATVSGSDSYAPLAPAGVSTSGVQGGQVTVTGKAEVNGEVLLYNDSEGTGPVTIQAIWGGGLDATFSGSIAASSGDWLRVRARDAKGNLGAPAMVQVSGSDTDAPAAPTGVKVTGKYNGYSSRCRVTGQAEPNSKLTIYSNSRRTTLQSNYSVPASGGFGVTIYGNCYSGDVLVLWINDGANNSPRIHATVSGSDSYAPLAPTNLTAGSVQGGQVTVTGKAEINGQALLYNDSAGTGPVMVNTSWSGLDAPFSASIAAEAGDWLRVRARDSAGNLGAAAMVQVGGSDTTAPFVPTGVKVTGKYNGYSSRCRVTGQAEPNSKLTIYSNSRRTTLQSNFTVPSSGGFGVTIYGNCYSGDVLQLWISDGSNSSPKVVGTVSGTDTYAPLAPASVSVGPVVSGQVTVSATVEINGSLVVKNTYDNSQYTGQADASGKATVTLPAWHGDTLELTARDAAGNTGSATFAAVP